MSPAEDPKADSAAGVVPRPNPQSQWRVVAVECLENYRLRVRFRDDTAGEVRMQSFLDGSAVTGTVFEALRDPRTFAQASIDLGTVAWPNGADLAPDAMYNAIRATGYWQVEA